MHHGWILPASIAGYVIVSNAADAMREPRPTDAGWYVFAYRFLHLMAVNWFSAFGQTGRTPWPGETPAAKDPRPKP